MHWPALGTVIQYQDIPDLRVKMLAKVQAASGSTSLDSALLAKLALKTIQKLPARKTCLRLELRCIDQAAAGRRLATCRSMPARPFANIPLRRHRNRGTRGRRYGATSDAMV